MKIFLLLALTMLAVAKGHTIDLIEPSTQTLVSAGRYVSMSGDHAITPGYIYERNNSGVWIEKGTTIGGNLVDIDGNTAINGNRIYERNLDGTWTSSQTLSLGISRKLGVAISGNYIAVLLTNGTEVFRKNGSTWEPMQTLNTLADTNDFFVRSDIDMEGDYIVVGSKQLVKVYKLNGSSWDLDASMPGTSVAISGDTIVTGSANNRGGSISFYQKDASGSSWQLNSTIVAPNLFPEDNVYSDILFGAHVAIDGNRALATSLSSRTFGLANAGHLIIKTAGEWQYQQVVEAGIGTGTLETRLGAIGISIDGGQAIISGLINTLPSVQGMFVYDISRPQPPTSLRCDFAFSPFTGNSQLDLFWENNDSAGIDSYEVELITKDLVPPQETTVNSYSISSSQLSQNIPIMSSIELPTEWKIRTVSGAIGEWSPTINISACTTTVIFN